jgi:prepilin-type N-terminal cleavage/methylation domain-containing protein/prepilin-type processing-associated H-X9-DG protein
MQRHSLAMQRHRRGFTLIELLVVITIIGMLVGLMMPALAAVRENGRRVQCTNNLHNLAVAMMNYEAKYRTFPPGRVGCDCAGLGINGLSCPASGSKADPRVAGTSGFALLLPELDAVPLYTQFMKFAAGAVFPGDEGALSGGPSGAKPSTTCSSDIKDNMGNHWYEVKDPNTGAVNVKLAMQERPPSFACPSDGRLRATMNSTVGGSNVQVGTNSYAMCMGAKGNAASTPDVRVAYGVDDTGVVAGMPAWFAGMFVYVNGQGTKDALDGTTQTILLGETAGGDDVGFVNSVPNRWPVAWAYQDSLRAADIFNGVGYDSKGQTIKNLKGGFASKHSGGANFAFVDGHVQYLTTDLMTSLSSSYTPNATITLLQALATRMNQESGASVAP